MPDIGEATRKADAFPSPRPHAKYRNMEGPRQYL